MTPDEAALNERITDLFREVGILSLAAEALGHRYFAEREDEKHIG